MSQTEANDLLIIYEPEAQQWATYLCSIFTGHIPRDAIRCFDIATVTAGQHHDFLGLGQYRCKVLILTQALVEEGGEGPCQIKRFFLSRVLSPAASVVVLLCGVESLAPLLALVPLQGEQCLLVSTEQEPHEYLAAVVKVVRGDTGKKHLWVPALDGQTGQQTNDTQSVVSTAAVTTRRRPDTGNSESPRAPEPPRGIRVVPFRVPCGASGELFVLLRDKLGSGDMEVEFRGRDQSVRVRPERWNEHVLLVRPPDFPRGKVEVTLYCGVCAVETTHIQYYSPLDEIAQPLKRVADPVEFMCQALRVSSLEKLDQRLASIVLEGMPSGGFQELGLLHDNTPLKGGPRHEDLPTLLHFAAQYGMRDLCGLLLQVPGAQRALHTANRHGMTPGAIARRHGHAELHVLLKEALREAPADDSVYEVMSTAGSQGPADPLKEEDEEEEGDEEDPYTLVGTSDEEYKNVPTLGAVAPVAPVAHRAPASTPRPDTTTAAPTSLSMDGSTTFIAQVFKNKTSKGNADMLSLPLEGQGRSASLTSSTYDTFIPGSGGAPAGASGGLDGTLSQLPARVKRGSLSVDRALEILREWQRLHCRGLDPLQQERLNLLRASVVNSRQDGDDSLYDQFNVVPPTKPTSAGRGSSEQAEFYSQSRKGPHSNAFWKAEKR